jgi:exosortase
MIPLPGIIVDALTNPLKRHVSEIAEQLLYAVGYPIARSGVTLTIGPYQLLVADACSGMHSLYSLTALGLLYLYLMKHASLLRNAILAACIIPIAIGANIVRVIFLVLVTYHLGDEAGQGFLHGFAGMVLFIAALLLLFVIDSALGLVIRSKHSGATK